MTFAAIVSGIFAIAKAVPIVADYIERFVDMYVDLQIAKMQRAFTTKKDKRNALMKAIQKATTDEERISLSIILADISRK